MYVGVKQHGRMETTVRVDRASKKASVVDVAKMVLSCDTDEAEAALRNLGAIPDEERRRINNSGRLTPVADVDTLLEIVWLLPGNISDDIRRKISRTVCRLLKADERLVRETEARHTEMRNSAQYSDMPAGFKYLSEEDRAVVAKRMVELFLKRKDLEIEERSISLKRKRSDHVIYCYQSLEELGMTLDAQARVHILDTLALITKPDSTTRL